MMGLRHFLRHFRRSEDGTATMEFVIVFPIFMLILGSSFEIGTMTIRETMLERAVDMTIRDIRLGTGTAPQHDELKSIICDRSPILHDCDAKLRLEMIQLDPRAWVAPPENADCTDASRDVEPVREFVNGQENEMMLLRVCMKVKPVFPTTGLGKMLVKDGAGDYALVAKSAFVQEPR